MTRRRAAAAPLLPDTDLPPRARGAFFDALDGYRAAFTDVPNTFGLPPRRLDELAPAMRQAVTRGRKLTAGEVAEALSLPPPVPPDVGLRSAMTGRQQDHAALLAVLAAGWHQRFAARPERVLALAVRRCANVLP